MYIYKDINDSGSISESSAIINLFLFKINFLLIIIIIRIIYIYINCV